MRKHHFLRTLFFIYFSFCLSNFSISQTASISGTVYTTESFLYGARIYLQEREIGAISDLGGNYKIQNLESGRITIRVSYLGYRTIEETIELVEGQNLTRHFKLEEDFLKLSDVVVTGTRSEIERYNSTVIISTVSDRIFETTQAVSISEGLNFSPGLRMENNCQNCGFTQLRMNGLDGAYSQILINSRPVFSALAGVYGLEMLPVNMVDRIEVVRGGGSVLYGGNAIAGTVNIITKDPIKNSFEVGLNQSFINFEAPDRTITVNGSVVNEKMNKGITFFGFNRTRAPWDANEDGFSEMVKMKNNTFGFDAFWNVSERSKLKFGAYSINEFRRGGNNFHLEPHQTDLTEQLQHNILSTNISYEWFSKNLKHKLSTYASFQHVQRASYYGSGGRVLEEGDELTEEDIIALNAYGNSRDFSTVGGFQYNYEINKKWMLISGTEYIHNDVVDEMPGYGRSIEQRVGSSGTYLQIEYKPTSKITLLTGGRYDHVKINGRYDLVADQFANKKNINVLVPRISALYKLKKNWKLRASFAQGYRGPQAFDEDLHLETVGGDARFILIDANLKTERSNSSLFSINYDKMLGKHQMNFVLEGFYTQLINPFILSNQQELSNGIAVITKRNGSGANIQGINLEANIAFSRKLVLQSGATLQTANYKNIEEIWAPEDENSSTPATFTKSVLRTPNIYGYFAFVYKPYDVLAISYSGTLTGSMRVAHVIDPETEQTVIKSTPVFFDNNIKIAYTLKTKSSSKFEIFVGVQNIFNSFQSDFDLGPLRDAGYVYGPLKPRTIFMGLKMGL
jgi:outer membrane receptor for ferrienterochelin and colicins